MKLASSMLSLLMVATSLLAEEGEPRLDDPVAPKAIPVEPEAPLGLQDLTPDIDAQPGVTHFGKVSVVGSRQVIRGGIASIAENLRVQLNSLTGDNDRKLQIPIIIRLYGKEGDKERKENLVSEIVDIQGQYQLRLHIHLAKGVDNRRLRYHLMELLLYERGLGAGQNVEDDERVLVKPWLIVGMLEALDIKAGTAEKKIYQADLPYFKILPLDQVFAASEAEWQAMQERKPLAFRAISGAMVNALLRQPDGRSSISNYLADVATFKGEMENLMRKHFPGMNKSQNSLEKWVDLEMAELGTAHMTDVYSIVDTDRRLESILVLRYQDPERGAVSVGIDGYQEVLKLEPAERFNAVAGARAELERLSYRCFPTYRPLLGEYAEILRELAEGEDKEISTRLKNLSDVRMKFQAAGKRVRDYLDWFYITQSHDVSGAFKEYRELSDALKREAMRPSSQDSTEQYLDQVQKIFGGE